MEVEGELPTSNKSGGGSLVGLMRNGINTWSLYVGWVDSVESKHRGGHIMEGRAIR